MDVNTLFLNGDINDTIWCNVRKLLFNGYKVDVLQSHEIHLWVKKFVSLLLLHILIKQLCHLVMENCGFRKLSGSKFIFIV